MNLPEHFEHLLAPTPQNIGSHFGEDLVLFLFRLNWLTQTYWLKFNHHWALLAGKAQAEQISGIGTRRPGFISFKFCAAELIAMGLCQMHHGGWSQSDEEAWKLWWKKDTIHIQIQKQLPIALK